MYLLNPCPLALYLNGQAPEPAAIPSLFFVFDTAKIIPAGKTKNGDTLPSLHHPPGCHEKIDQKNAASKRQESISSENIQPGGEPAESQPGQGNYGSQSQRLKGINGGPHIGINPMMEIAGYNGINGS